MNFPLQLQQKAGHFVAQNASGILTAGGVIGVGVTAILTGRASSKAAMIMREKQAIRNMKAREAANQISIDNDSDLELVLTADFTRREVVAATWTLYIPAAVAGVATIGCIVMANRVSAKRAAALAAAYGISERRFHEYRDKVTEKLGLTKERAVRDEIAQDQVNSNPPNQQVLILGSGDVLCYDSLTGRYFNSSVEQIKTAENKINQELFSHQAASLSEFYDEIGLPATTISDELGWNTTNMEPLEIKFSTTMAPDNRPCLVLDYSRNPTPDYHRFY